MIKSLGNYYKTAFEQLNFIFIPEKSSPCDRIYKMLPDYGEGTIRQINCNNLFFVLIADFTPKEHFVRVSQIHEDYLEISQFETDSSSFKIGRKKLNHVDKGICCYINTSKTVYTHCEAQSPTRFTKILITQTYYDRFLKKRFEDGYTNPKDAIHFLSQNPNLPKLNYIFHQIRDCNAQGNSQQLYFESKVLEILSLVTDHLEQSQKRPPLKVRLDKRDLRGLRKVVNFIKKDLSAYPSITQLSKISNMSTTRFQMAFKQTYGTTVYHFLKEIRMNHALLLLKNSDYNIKDIAAKVGYTNAGHFAGIFRKTYGINPKEYRTIHQIK
ncbi:MAG: AraC family transcriptional regulator [Marinisporobacter sp.]|nr:AraC family transcriptional regulator [Marinisporobacter sp.]